jgi:hypothetical protein
MSRLDIIINSISSIDLGKKARLACAFGAVILAAAAAASYFILRHAVDISIPGVVTMQDAKNGKIEIAIDPRDIPKVASEEGPLSIEFMSGASKGASFQATAKYIRPEQGILEASTTDMPKTPTATENVDVRIVVFHGPLWRLAISK